jgi:hypothetical protein
VAKAADEGDHTAVRTYPDRDATGVAAEVLSPRRAPSSCTDSTYRSDTEEGEEEEEVLALLQPVPLAAVTEAGVVVVGQTTPCCTTSSLLFPTHIEIVKERREFHTHR